MFSCHLDCSARCVGSRVLQYLVGVHIYIVLYTIGAPRREVSVHDVLIQKALFVYVCVIVQDGMYL